MVTAVGTAAARLIDLVAREGALVVGVGHSLRGDDAVGSAIAASLAPRFAGRAIDAGPVPESYLGSLLVSPRPVVFLDAVMHGGEPGSWCVISAAELESRAPDTHRASLHLLAELLRTHGVEAWVVGIEPRQLNVGAPLSPEVECTAAELVGLLTAALMEASGDG
jgi:hydrogenase maturation protease